MPTSAPVSTLASIEKITISLGAREGSDFAFYEKKYTLIKLFVKTQFR